MQVWARKNDPANNGGFFYRPAAPVAISPVQVIAIIIIIGVAVFGPA
jgi:hypothetical protein